jgi:hypothetical protein
MRKRSGSVRLKVPLHWCLAGLAENTDHKAEPIPGNARNLAVNHELSDVTLDRNGRKSILKGRYHAIKSDCRDVNNLFDVRAEYC